jgi:hypothetical protein
MTPAHQESVHRMTRCYFCGNEATGTQPLVASDDHPGFKEHAPARPCADAIDARGEPRARRDGTMRCGHDECSPDWACPAPPDGWGSCRKCYHGRPIDDLMRVERRANRYGELVWTTVIEDETTVIYCCADGCREWRRVLRNRKQVTARAVDRDDDTRQAHDTDRFNVVPDDGDGLDRRALSSLWDVGDSTTRNLIARGIEASRLRVEERPTRAGGVPRKVYWRVDQ